MSHLTFHPVERSRNAEELPSHRAVAPGDFQGPHHIAIDSKGNLYVAEVAPGNRAQKFLLKGRSPTPPPNALTAEQLAR